MNLTSAARKYGNYKVGHKEFLLLQEALDYAKNDFHKVRYSMFGVDNLDLSQDPFPGLTISDLYRIRAQEIRDSYDYLVLNLSGGPDSMNILNTFVDNNIMLDEIVNYNSLNSTGVIHGTGNNTDYVYNVRPCLQELEKRPGWRTKFTVIDEVDLVTRLISTAYRSGHEELLHGAGGPNGNTSVRGQGIQYVDHVWKMIKDGKKVGVIIGTDKPWSKVINNQRCLIFTDVNRSQFVEFIIDNQVPPYMEWFYQSDFRIACKQAYMLQKFVTTNTSSALYEPIDCLAKSGFRNAHNWPGADGMTNLKYAPFHHVIYPGYTPAVITPKDQNTLLRPRDNWWLHNAEDKLKRFYARSIVKWNEQTATNDYSKHRILKATKVKIDTVWIN